ncbi:hypothetical protein [Lactiplantibacillus plantarum]|uniref:hypothetical protein n=1 Tax=Lactiplantibacillus plantarum TaxID=1590 RepID=UPI0007B54BDC|nr:hypothetical protein [Lactiplantibacillus plantarum]KZU18653.1 hypothetical protein Nizo2484_2135 [Lactiplantibacillus plantarum]
MSFEDKRNEMGTVLSKSMRKNTPRISKSYTLKPELAEELARRADSEELTASRYLERILKEEFNLKD